jgi:nicotinamide-nucleotide adenylyltransferase
MTTRSLLHRVQAGLSHVELIHAPHDLWPLPLHSASLHRPLTVLVLDSSFNPPTLAHLALANTRPPPNHPPQYDAKLLLLSVKNADKSLKLHDASYLQRLDMMSLLTKDILPEGDASNIAIAVTDQPTFVAKSNHLQSFFQSRFLALSATYPNISICNTQLTFILGLDTLERLVQPHYYGSESDMIASLRKFLSPPPEGDDSHVVYARRAFSKPGQASNPLAPAQEFISSGRINLVDIDEDLRSCSSSEVRDTIARLGPDFRGGKKLVTDRIADYILAEKLYCGQS